MFLKFITKICETGPTNSTFLVGKEDCASCLLVHFFPVERDNPLAFLRLAMPL